MVRQLRCGGVQLLHDGVKLRWKELPRPAAKGGGSAASRADQVIKTGQDPSVASEERGLRERVLAG
jgi:hypothetical protein